MARKQVENKYGVKVGDIFVYEGGSDGDCYHSFYQVTALRGATLVVLRKSGLKNDCF